MPTREIYEPLTDSEGNQVFDEQGTALTVLVGTEQFKDEPIVPRQEYIVTPEVLTGKK